MMMIRAFCSAAVQGTTGSTRSLLSCKCNQSRCRWRSRCVGKEGDGGGMAIVCARERPWCVWQVTDQGDVNWSRWCCFGPGNWEHWAHILVVSWCLGGVWLRWSVHAFPTLLQPRFYLFFVSPTVGGELEHL